MNKNNVAMHKLLEEHVWTFELDLLGKICKTCTVCGEIKEAVFKTENNADNGVSSANTNKAYKRITYDCK